MKKRPPLTYSETASELEAIAEAIGDYGCGMSVEAYALRTLAENTRRLGATVGFIASALFMLLLLIVVFGGLTLWSFAW